MTSYEIGEAVATTSEYTEILTMIYNTLVTMNEGLLGIYALGWVIAGSIAALALMFSILSMFKT